MWLKETKNANESIFRLFWVLKEAIWTPRMTRSFTNRWQYEFVLSSGEKKKRQPPAFAEFLYVTVRCQRKARYYEHHFPLTIRTLFRTQNIGDSHTKKRRQKIPTNGDKIWHCKWRRKRRQKPFWHHLSTRHCLLDRSPLLIRKRCLSSDHKRTFFKKTLTWLSLILKFVLSFSLSQFCIILFLSLVF